MGPLPDYMYDLSHIFDGCEDVYMDYVHVWESGNRIIAKEIGSIIRPVLENEEKINICISKCFFYCQRG